MYTFHTVRVEDLKKDFLKIISEVKDQDEFIIIENGKPIAKIVPLYSSDLEQKQIKNWDEWLSDETEEPLPDEFWFG
jgi:prevent-host-death family protein